MSSLVFYPPLGLHRLQAEAALTTILLVDNDDSVAFAVRDVLAPTATVIVAATYVEAIDALQSHAVDVMLVDGSSPTLNSPSLIERAQSMPQRVTTILLMTEATAREAESALDRGVAGILDKPLSAEELQRTVHRALNGGSFRGDLSGISLLDLFQVFNLSRRSLVVRVGGMPPARVWFENGEIVHAECGPDIGETVLERLVDVRTGAIRTLPFTPAPRTIDRLFHSLLLNILRAQDESRKDEVDVAADVSRDAAAVDGEWELSDEDFQILEDDGSPDRAAIAETAIAETAIAETAVAETAISETTVAETAAAEATVAETAIAETAADEPVWLPEPAPADDADDELMWSAKTVLPQRSLDPICRAITAELPACMASAIVDLASGQLLGMHNSADFLPPFERFISLYVRQLFRGPEIQHIERTIQEQRGLPIRSGFLEEIVLTSRHTHHLTRLICDGDIAVMVVTPRRVPTDQTWPRLRVLLPGIESNIEPT